MTDPLDATETLFETVRVPRQIIVHHQMGTLEINAFTCRICRNEDLHILVLGEGLLRLSPFLTTHPPMDRHNQLGTSQESSYALSQIGQRIPVFSKNDEFSAMPLGVNHFGVILKKF